MIIRRK